MTSIAVAEVAPDRPPSVRFTAGLLQPRLVARSPGFAHIALVAGGATLLGGDAVSITVEVGPGCTLRIEDIGGTVAYPSTGRPSEWNVDVRVGDGGVLVWESLPFVVTDGAVVDRRIAVRRAPDAVVCLRETLVLGRSGEAGGRIVSGTDIRDVDGRAYFIEELSLDGNHPQPGVLGSSRVLDTAMLIGLEPDEGESSVSGAGEEDRVLVLARPGAVVRAIGSATHAAHVDARWRRWKNRAEQKNRVGRDE